MATNTERGLWFQTASGRIFYPHAPKAAEVFLGDIARALSMQCRFNGHSEVFYSVAEHSRWVSLRLAPVEELDVLERATSAIGKQAYADLVLLGLAGLMHDAAEAYVGDMVSPIKHDEKMVAFVRLEASILGRIFERFGLSYGYTVAEAVKVVDRRMLLTEKRDLRKPPRHGTPPWQEEESKMQPYDDLKLRGEDPARAEELFLARFQELWTRKTGSRWDDIEMDELGKDLYLPEKEAIS